MTHQYMPKIFHGPHKNSPAPPSYIINVQSVIVINLFVFLTITEVSRLLIGTRLLILRVLFLIINFLPASGSSSFMYMMETIYSTISKCFTTPVCLLIH